MTWGGMDGTNRIDVGRMRYVSKRQIWVRVGGSRSVITGSTGADDVAGHPYHG